MPGRTLVIQKHERRLNGVGEGRVAVAIKVQLEQREDTLSGRRIGREREHNPRRGATPRTPP